MATGGREEDPHTCAVCLGSYRNPKFLPCHHTFCAPCIQDIADRHPGCGFPCPSCRRVASLPSGGVASLQTNFYVQPQSPKQKAGAQDMCKIHPDKKLRFYCMECDEAICISCKLTKHEGHKTDDLATAAAHKKKELQDDKARLERAVSDVTKRVTSLHEDRQSIDKKRAAVEKNIHDRHATMVAAADTHRDKELQSLKSQHADLDKDVVGDIAQQEGNKAELSSLLQRLNDAITSGTDGHVVTVAKEMRSGRGSQQEIDALTSGEERPLRRPVLQFNVSTDVMMQTTRDYLGSARTMEMKGKGPEVRVTERFQCAQDPDVEVFSLCHKDEDLPVVRVSYERCGGKEDAPVKTFTETGDCVGTGAGKHLGKVPYRRYAKGQCMFLHPQPGMFKTYCKSPTAAHFILNNRLSGRADIKRETVTSTDPFRAETKTEFSIQVGPHRAFDVNETEQHFAVVEEAGQSTFWRSVRLYRRSVEKAVSTYSPPAPRFQPSDVCFYTLGGQEVLLVTDELNDAMHVVTIQGDTMRFERYLCGGCPSLIQPTAITVDVKGRLWVACRGGAVLMIEQVS
ncbi:uncharacterized protein LOC143288123 [Babylonia areolata]|uniref:uncharacterized protein LOC143288123 n=1 Tax=Babylonia areolata TaxID=304850 RepID=UPI003FD25DB9